MNSNKKNVAQLKTQAKRSTEEVIILTLSLGACLGVSPFFLYRLAIADWAVALLDGLAVIATAVLFFYVLRTGNTKIAGRILALICLIVVSTTIYIRGPEQLLWVYPALTATFFLLTPKFAAAWCTLLLAFIGVTVWSETSAFILFEFYVSAIATLLFSFAFADRMRDQNRKLVQLATKDPLTGANNRRAMEQKLLEMVAFNRRDQDTASSLILMDLDKFKEVNDKYGHQVGDNILVEFVNTVSNRIRSSDELYRFGGEEFVVIAENISFSDASTLADQLRIAVMDNSQLADYNVTISVGTAEFQTHETPFEWLGRADKAMYRAKDQGRNTCCVA
jgi:diguanylate cyclase (GGDEF)-like protein